MKQADFIGLEKNSDGMYLRGREDLGHGPNEGERWKGSGVIAELESYNYIKFREWLLKREGIDDPLIVELGASYVAEKYPFTSAISWIENNRLLDICLNDGFDACCYKINGGWADTKNGSTSMRGAADTWCKEHASQINIRQR